MLNDLVTLMYCILDACCYEGNLAIAKRKPAKNSGFNGIRTRDLKVAFITAITFRVVYLSHAVLCCHIFPVWNIRPEISLFHSASLR